tara:strand:+ start:3173 stop:3454 length:282 start_codon:yes stop_codon:yes gene_type:complete
MKILRTAKYIESAPNLDVPQERSWDHGLPYSDSSNRLTEPEGLQGWEGEHLKAIREGMQTEIADLQERIKALDEAWGASDRERLEDLGFLMKR